MSQNYQALSYQSKINIATLIREKVIEFNLIFDREDLINIAEALKLEMIKKPIMRGKILKLSDDNWKIKVVIGATVLQKSVLTLKPVTTRIDETIIRRLVKGPDLSVQKSELELNDDDFIENELSLGDIFFECMALNIPSYPKAKNESFVDVRVTKDRTTLKSSEKTSPFAVLSTLTKNDQN